MAVAPPDVSGQSNALNCVQYAKRIAFHVTSKVYLAFVSLAQRRKAPTGPYPRDRQGLPSHPMICLWKTAYRHGPNVSITHNRKTHNLTLMLAKR